jgi:transcriptional regulator with GAF, ATPase, and Fis domain
MLSKRSKTIRNQDILSAIREIGETLALTNEPRQLTQTVMDTLVGLFALDCCWLQLLDSENGGLSLEASRGFDAGIQNMMEAMDKAHQFAAGIVGLGNKVIIPDLKNDTQYEITAFEQAGYASLIAVPIITYRAHGILGFAYRKTRKFPSDFSGLLAVIANLIGMAINKSMLAQLEPSKIEKTLPSDKPVPDDDKNKAANKGNEKSGRPVAKSRLTERQKKSFQEHKSRMKMFSKSHDNDIKT